MFTPDYPTEPQPAIRIPATIHKPSKLTPIVIAAFVVLAAAVGVALYLVVQARGQVGTLTVQTRQLRGQVAMLKFTEHDDYTTVNGKIISLGHSVAPVPELRRRFCVPGTWTFAVNGVSLRDSALIR